LFQSVTLTQDMLKSTNTVTYSMRDDAYMPPSPGVSTHLQRISSLLDYVVDLNQNLTRSRLNLIVSSPGGVLAEAKSEHSMLMSLV